jgi:hypothetical protein
MKDVFTLVKGFPTEKEANAYAVEKKGRVEVKYDYDEMKREIVKTFLVKVSY